PRSRSGAAGSARWPARADPRAGAAPRARTAPLARRGGDRRRRPRRRRGPGGGWRPRREGGARPRGAGYSRARRGTSSARSTAEEWGALSWPAEMQEELGPIPGPLAGAQGALPLEAPGVVEQIPIPEHRLLRIHDHAGQRRLVLLLDDEDRLDPAPAPIDALAVDQLQAHRDGQLEGASSGNDGSASPTTVFALGCAGQLRHPVVHGGPLEQHPAQGA